MIYEMAPKNPSKSAALDISALNYAEYDFAAKKGE